MCFCLGSGLEEGLGQWSQAFWFSALSPSNTVRTLPAPHLQHISLTFPRSPQEHRSPSHLHGGTESPPEALRVPQRHWGKSLLLVMLPAASTQGPAPQAKGQGQPRERKGHLGFRHSCPATSCVVRTWSPALPPSVYPGGLGSTALESFPITSVILISSIWM